MAGPTTPRIKPVNKACCGRTLRSASLWMAAVGSISSRATRRLNSDADPERSMSDTSASMARRNCSTGGSCARALAAATSAAEARASSRAWSKAARCSSSLL